MSRALFSLSWRGCALLALSIILLVPHPARAVDAPVKISGVDVYGKPVTVNDKGHYTFVIYSNPDLEDDSREMTRVLDKYRSNSNFRLVCVVDLRGGIPPTMRGIVRTDIRNAQAKENKRLAKTGGVGNYSPVIADFTGDVLDALGWDSIYDEVQLIVYDSKGHEVKRLKNVSDAQQVKKIAESVL